MAKSKKINYCCDRFRDSVDEKKFAQAYMQDETDWFMPEWLHIYFCPFCGTNVKGKGHGTFDTEKKAKP